jgi:hypothetical protein
MTAVNPMKATENSILNIFASGAITSENLLGLIIIFYFNHNEQKKIHNSYFEVISNI